ncbi:MAG: hypothetical protein ACMG51_10030, partial [Ginsengibacter sp.]
TFATIPANGERQYASAPRIYAVYGLYEHPADTAAGRQSVRQRNLVGYCLQNPHAKREKHG